MGLVLYDLLLRMKYPIPDKNTVIYGREGGQECDVLLGSNQYDQTRVIQADEEEVIHFVLMAVSHRHFVIDRSSFSESNPVMLVKDLSRNGTFVSFEGGEYRPVDRVGDRQFEAVKGTPIKKGSRIKLGESSDHVLEVMSDEAASELIMIFESLRTEADEEKAEQQQQKKPGLFGFLKRKAKRG